MINRPLLTTNAYFYKVKKPPLAKAAIAKMQAQASAKKHGHVLFKKIREALNVGGESFNVSLIVFKRQMPPPFLEEGPETEIRHCYLFLIEYEHFLIASKLGTQDFIDIVEKKIDSLDYREITGLKITPTTLFQKIGVWNMDTSPSAMRRMVFEGPNVKDNLSPLATSNKIVTSLKVKNKDQNSSIAPNTSRINDLGKRQDVKFFCYWAATQCKQVDQFVPQSTYLSNFAEQLDFKANIKRLSITSVLFNFSGLLEGLEDGSIAEIHFVDKNSRSRPINFKALTETHDFCLDVDFNKKARDHRIMSSFDKSLYIRQLSAGFAIISSKLDRVKIIYTTGETYTLIDLINKASLFIISFNNVDIRYWTKTLFRDMRGLKDMPHFLKSFEPDPNLQKATSEKGDLCAVSKQFETNSLFGYIEAKLASDCDFLICDDLGNEWAGYIGFKKDEFIRFYHAKHSSKQFSASAFHDVVSQALKNLGNLNFNQNLDGKKRKISQKYGLTQISRLRKGSSTQKCFQDLTTTYNNPKTIKEIVLVVDFISMKDLQQQMNLLASGSAKNEAVQVLWLLSSLFGECLQRGIRPSVITKP